MNEITNTEVPFDVNVDMVEVLDEQGNPTGQYKAREGEAAPAEATVFTTAEDGEHVIN